MTKMSGKCMPPSKGSFMMKMSPGPMLLPNWRMIDSSAVGIEPRCPGSVSPCATSLPSASARAVEKSILSFSTPEYVVRMTVSAISSAMEKIAFLNSSKPIGSMPYYPCMSKDIYASLGVKRRINAAGTLTRLGGALMDEEVLGAMAASARASVDIGELQAAASRTIAKITGAEAGIVSTGAAAALTLAAAAAMTRWDIAKMAALPQTEGFPNEILLPRTHYTGYAHALRASGARLVDLGHNDRGTGAGVRGIEPWEIEAAITPRTAAFAFAAHPANVHDLAAVVAGFK